ncbi:MAG: inositol monophosphatase family protein, partial [Leisingera sp.]
MRGSPVTGDLDIFLKAAVHMAELARPVARTVWEQPGRAGFKEDGSMITRADLEIEQLWRAFLQEQFPDHGIWGEEFGGDQAAEGWTWVLDPIDGTRHFGMGLPGFSTLISLCCDGVPVLGVMDLPLGSACFSGVRGGAALLNGRPLQASGADRLAACQAAIANHDSFTGGSPPSFHALRETGRGSAFFARFAPHRAPAQGQLGRANNGTHRGGGGICAPGAILEGGG